MKQYDKFDGTFMEYCEFLDSEKEKEMAFLDMLDVLPFLTKGIEIEDLMSALHQQFNDEYDGEDMFDALDEQDIIDYLTDRFHVDFDCVVSTCFYLHTDLLKGTRYDQDFVSDVSEVE